MAQNPPRGTEKRVVNITTHLKKNQLRGIKKLVKAQEELIAHNIAVVLQDEAIPHLIDLIMVGYDSLSDRMNTMQAEDPTNPAFWRDEFKALLEKDAADTFRFDPESKTIKVELGEKTQLGYIDTEKENPDKSDKPLVWMVYYLEGLAGSWAWITKEMYLQVFPDGSWDPEWGRFKDSPGFMLGGAEFFNRDIADKFGGGESPWRHELRWTEVRHPFSSFTPVDIFEEAMNEFQVRPFVEKAIRAARSGRRL